MANGSSSFKTCSCTRQGRCAHPYAIRYRDASGRQREETGYSTQQGALDRLTEIYNEKRNTPRQQAELKRELGKQRFGEYASAWLARQRHYTAGSTRTVNTLLQGQILPALESRRINTFTSTVVEDFIMSMEEGDVGLATWDAARKRAGITRKLNPYSLRHYFASNCLSKGIPITDVAEWMGHKNIGMTFRIYRHLMPASIGRAAKVLNEGL
ncbi:tyrosine-type recombinase/integrase [Streptomyces sp. GS7]|nr:tyrosine-type recombinase/integrase [Streptomyces sp. GS7]